jgi:DNA-binding CsgD family transcriptional regulator
MIAGWPSLVAQFDQAAVACSSWPELCHLVDAAVRDLGFEYCALLHHASLSGPGAGLIRFDTYPAGWSREIEAQGLASDDPVHLASARTHLGFRWDAIDRLVPLTSRHRDILARGARYGIGGGFTVPANVPGEPTGSISLAVRRGRTVPARHLPLAELIGAHAFGAARRMHGYPAGGSRPHLSRREVQCLRLVAAGKTDWEIGRVLGITEATARQYVKRARSAYDVVGRAQLVVHGLRDGWIGFGDAIPPSGGMG